MERQQAKEQRDRLRKEELTAALETTGGLWKTSDDVDQHLATLPAPIDKKSALHTQVKFRRFVLGAKNSNGILFLSSAGKPLTVDQLTSNLKCAIRIAADEAAESTPTNTGTLCVVSPLIQSVVEAEKRKFQELADKECQKDHAPPAKRRKTEPAPVEPRVVVPEDLIGKRVEHLCVEGDQEAQWYLGVVTGLKISKEGKFVYSIMYDCAKKRTYEFPLLDHFETGVLRLFPVDSAYLVGKKIQRRFCSSDSGEDYWGTGTVFSHTGPGKYVTNYHGLVSEEEEDDEGPSMFEESLEEDYAAGDIRICV
jgi:hypothetical protein